MGSASIASRSPLPSPCRGPDGRWDLAEAIACQRRLRERVVDEDRIGHVRRVAGADVAYSPRSGLMHAAVVVVDAATLKVLETSTEIRPVSFPYVPGFLSFRESPAILAAADSLRRRVDLLMVDGHGLAHPRRFGIASHLGVLLDLPTVGVAKSVLVGRGRPPGDRRGCRTRLVHRGQRVACTLRTRTGVAPVYVSVGHRVGLDTAVRWVLRCGAGYRLPEPTRQAHVVVNALKSRGSPQRFEP